MNPQLFKSAATAIRNWSTAAVKKRKKLDAVSDWYLWLRRKREQKLIHRIPDNANGLFNWIHMGKQAVILEKGN